MKSNRSVPEAHVVPVLVYEDVRSAVEWLMRVFGFTVRVHIPPFHRVQLCYGAFAVIAADRGAAGPAGVLLRVEDVDAVCARAGDRVVSPANDWEYGERQATIEDPGGHRWTVSQTLRDAEPESWGGITGRL
ncbi:MAG TPA: VOC family protein [Gaiellaceae bacterium]